MEKNKPEFRFLSTRELIALRNKSISEYVDYLADSIFYLNFLPKAKKMENITINLNNEKLCELEKLAKLKNDGILTEEEFIEAKKKILESL